MYYKLIVTGHTFVQPASIDIPTREYTTLCGLFLVLYLSVILKSLLFTLLGVNRNLYSVMIMRNIWHFCVAERILIQFYAIQKAPHISDIDMIHAMLFVCSHLPVFILIKYNYFSVLSAAISAIDFVRPAIP